MGETKKEFDEVRTSKLDLIRSSVASFLLILLFITDYALDLYEREVESYIYIGLIAMATGTTKELFSKKK